ncbi:MAG: aspartate aminotransferase family protein [Cyanobacteria bacterium P01_C01_bin.120]
MNFTTLPETAFIHPSGQNREAITALFSQVVEQILAQLTTAAQRPPLPQITEWPAIAIPTVPTDLSTLLQTVDQACKTGMNPAHPRYIGHMDPLPTTASIIGDWVVAALNNNMLSVEMSPLFSRLEPLLLREIAQLFGLGDRAGGLLVSGGSLANLQALAVARNVQLDCAQTGLIAQAKPPVFFVSEVAHTSIQKAAMLLGLGTDAAIAIPTNHNCQMEIVALRAAISTAHQRGQRPFALVATAGTTVTGNIDPLGELAAIAQAENLWFHVDAAYGGALVFSEQYRDRLRGIEQADSVTFNPQKWLYVSKTCASVLFRDLSHLQRHFQVVAPYMNTEADWTNLGEISVQGTRHADVLKLWLSLQHLGKRGYGELIAANYALTETFVAAVQARPFLALASQPEMNIVCFRGIPPGLSADQWDDWNRDLQGYLRHQAQAFLSLPRYRGQSWLKVVLLNPYTTEDEVHQLFAAIDEFAQ